MLSLPLQKAAIKQMILEEHSQRFDDGKLRRAKAGETGFADAVCQRIKQQWSELADPVFSSDINNFKKAKECWPGEHWGEHWLAST